MIVFGHVEEPYGFSPGGYAEGFLQDWWNAQLAAGDITEAPEGCRFTAGAEHALLRRLAGVAGMG